MLGSGDVVALLVIGLVVLLLFLLIAPIWLIVRVRTLARQNEELEERTHNLRWRLDKLEAQAGQARRTGPEPAPAAPSATAAAAPAIQPTPETLPPVRPSKPAVVAPQSLPVGVIGTKPAPPTPPPIPAPVRQPETPPATAPVAAQAPKPVSVPPFSAPLPKPAFNFEQFLGVKLFAWLGGLVAFLAAAFFIKYSFDNNLISPQMRVAGGLLFGLGLIVGGLKLSGQRYAVTVQTLCAAGVLVLYADFFAAHVYYKLVPSTVMTFGLMVLVTGVAFLLAVRLNAQVVAVLGLLGGFLTPVLLSTGKDNPLGLFGYLAVLDLGLMAVALRKRWLHLVLLAAVATVVMEFAWVEKFFAAEKWLTAMTIFLCFAALFYGAYAFAHRRLANEAEPGQKWTAAAAILIPGAALAFALYLLGHPYRAICGQPAVLFSFIFLADLALLGVAWLHTRLRAVQLFAGGAVFLLLAFWAGGFLTDALLNTALAGFLVFAVLHSVFPVVVQRLRPGEPPVWWMHLFPSLALLLVLFPMFKLSAPSFLLWPVVLLIDALALLLAVITASLAAVLAVLVLTALATAVWVLRVPVSLEGWVGLPGTLLIIGGFALVFFFFGIFAVKRLLPRFNSASTGRGEDASADKTEPSKRETITQISSMAAILPFLLLTMVVLRLPLANPSPVFGLAALMGVLLLGVVRVFRTDWLAPIALGCTLLVEYVWQQNRFHGTGAAPDWLPLGWYCGFALAYLLFPFVFHQQVEERRAPWATAALALPLHFALIYSVCKANLPAFGALGLVPAVCALPPLVGLVWLLRRIATDNPARNALLALFGGATLFFITLIFPIQFDKQWLTVAWALEGAALLWLFHRVPHPGLRIVGVALLVVAFARLALNPAVFTYPRSATRIFNWYLYSYGIVTVSLFAGARLLHPPRHRVRNTNVLPLLYSLGTVLAFFLLNIEIADYFSTGATLTFKFSGNVARDMTYSLAWGLFAFVLLAIGFKKRIAGARRAGMALMSVTLLKLFFHDLWHLGGLYRIGALIGLAAVLILASFIYQKFFAGEATEEKAAKPDVPTNA